MREPQRLSRFIGMEVLDPLAKTALWTASMRARETARADCLFTDPLAALLAGDEGPQIMGRFEDNVQKGVEDPVLAVRTKFLDDEIAALAASGVRQFAFVAAGMDTRAFRLPWPTGSEVFELDRPALLQLKDERISQVGAKPKARRISLGVDLLADWTTPLRSAGFNPKRPTAWLVEGLLYFLDSAERDRLLRELTELSAPGSKFMADYVSASSLQGAAMLAWRERMAAQGHPWRSGCDEPEQLMRDFGWSAKTTVYGEPKADYGRWAHAVVAPGVTATRGRYLIVASLEAMPVV